MENLVTRFTKVLKRTDGSEVKLVAQAYVGLGLHSSVGVDVFKRENNLAAWKLCSPQPSPGWKTMSRAEYLQHGRSEMLQTVTVGEILSVSSQIGKRIDSLPADVTVH